MAQKTERPLCNCGLSVYLTVCLRDVCPDTCVDAPNMLRDKQRQMVLKYQRHRNSPTKYTVLFRI